MTGAGPSGLGGERLRPRTAGLVVTTKCYLGHGFLSREPPGLESSSRDARAPPGVDTRCLPLWKRFSSVTVLNELHGCSVQGKTPKRRVTAFLLSINFGGFADITLTRHLCLIIGRASRIGQHLHITCQGCFVSLRW